MTFTWIVMFVFFLWMADLWYTLITPHRNYKNTRRKTTLYEQWDDDAYGSYGCTAVESVRPIYGESPKSNKDAAS